MRSFRKQFSLSLSVVALLLASFLPLQSMAAQDTDDSFYFEEQDLTLDWVDPWTLGGSENSEFVALDRANNISAVIFIFDSASVPPETAVWLLMEDEDELLEDQSASYPPRITIQKPDQQLVYVIESYTVNDGETTVLAVLFTVKVLVEPAVEYFQAEVSLNGNPLFMSESTSGTDEPADATAEATAVTTSRTSRTSRSTETPEATEEATSDVQRTTRGSTEATEEATEEPTTEVTRTSRSGSGAAETPEATEGVPVTEDPTEVATGESTEEGTESLGMDTFIGPIYGYSFEYNPNIWQVDNEIESTNIDGIRLSNETATVAIFGLDSYGADPVGCLIGEDEYYGSEAESISDWDVATDANGNPLWHEGDELSWGVFSYTFTSSSGEEVELVDYISCETIPGQDAVLIVQMTSFPDDYNTNLDLILDVLDTLEFQP